MVQYTSKTNSLAINCLLQFISIFSTTCTYCVPIGTALCQAKQASRPPMHHQRYQYASSFVSIYMLLIYYIGSVKKYQHSTHFLITQQFNSTESNLLIELLCVCVLFQLLHLFAYIFRSLNNKSRAYDLGRFDKTSTTLMCVVNVSPLLLFLIVHYYNVA